uniref:Uncharacterized protein n=1 Tax=Tanacetum cinerariifolium TaxID=118510 RepID=A0A699HXS8_TANCI|nr:hypothetical protein [Tanacetum cinerariifolium]
MYYSRFTKVIIHHFMSKDPSIPRRNKINWHYVRDDSIFLTIKVVSRHQNTQQYGAMLPIELINDKIRNTKAYKEYYACATGEAAPKPKASTRRKKSGSDTSITPPTAITTPTTTVAAAKGKQPAKAKSPSDPSEMKELVLNQGFQMYPLMIQTKNSHGTLRMMKILMLKKRTKMTMKEIREMKEIAKTDEQDDAERGGDDDEESKSDEESDGDKTREEDSFDPIPRTPKDSEDDGNGEEDQSLRISEEERLNEEEEVDELYRDVDINQGRGLQLSQDIEDSHVTLTPVNPDGQQESSSVSSQFVTSMLNPTSDAGMESIFVTASSPVAPLKTSTPIMTPSIIATITTISHAPIPPTIIPSEVLQNLPTFDSVFRFEDRLKSLEANFSKYIQTNPFAEVVSNIPGIVHQYMNQQMTEAVQVAVQIQTNRLHDSYQRENDKFLRTIDENMKRIIKEQVKSQVKEQVLRILQRIEQSVNAQLEAEVLTRSSHSSRTSYAVAADLLEMELKKILIKKMEGNKSIQRLDKQRNLYKALVDAYEADKTILDSYGDTVILKRRRDDDDDQEEGPSAGSDRGSTIGFKSRQVSASESAFAEEPVQTISQMDEPSYPMFETGANDQTIVQSSQHPEWFSQPKKPPTPDRDWNKTLPAVQGSTQTWISELAKQIDSCSSYNELLDTPLDFSNFIMNWLRVDTLTPELLAGPTFDLMKGSCTSLIKLEYHLEEVLRSMWIHKPINYDKHALWGVSHWGWKRQQFYGFTVNRESAPDVYSKRRIIAVTDLKIVEWHSYKHLDWITVRRGDDKLYKFKEGDFKMLRLQDIKDMLLLLVQGKLSNLTIEERFAFNVSLRMFTRSIVIQRRVEDLQLGVESYQKRLNLTKPDMYRSDLKRKEAYTAYSNPRGFIYQNKDKKNRLMRIDELHKFSDGTLNDVRNALDNHLKGIRMQYLPQTIWRKGDKDRASAMIQAIDKMLKTRRIMRSLERFIGGILYEGDFRML